MSIRWTILRVAILGSCLLRPSITLAAISSPRLIVTDFGKNRLEEISFYVLCILFLTAITRWIWNGFHKEFPNWPVFSYRGALGMLLLWGTAVTMVVSFITAIRQSMTPAASETTQYTSRLNNRMIPTTNPEIIDRRIRLRSLWRAMSFYANANESRFPNTVDDLEMGVSNADPATGFNYFITPDLKSTSPRTILACEPDIYPQRLLLFTDGTIAIEERGGGGGGGGRHQ